MGLAEYGEDFLLYFKDVSSIRVEHFVLENFLLLVPLRVSVFKNLDVWFYNIIFLYQFLRRLKLGNRRKL